MASTFEFAKEMLANGSGEAWTGEFQSVLAIPGATIAGSDIAAQSLIK